MKLREFALLATLLAAYGGAYAAGAAVSGTAVINGKTVAFSQGRAWKTGGFGANLDVNNVVADAAPEVL